MICGNDPHADLEEEDRAAMEWFWAWMAWRKLPAQERATVPEPVYPDARKGI
jgi:hypothetical protein